jgi:hypothetical protein
MVEWLKVMTLSSNPSSEKKRKEKPRSSFSHTQWCIPVMPATWETEVGRPQSTGLGKNVYVFQTLFAKQTKKDWKKGCTYLKWWRACLSLTPSTLTPPTSQNCLPRLFFSTFLILFVFSFQSLATSSAFAVPRAVSELWLRGHSAADCRHHLLKLHREVTSPSTRIGGDSQVWIPYPDPFPELCSNQPLYTEVKNTWQSLTQRSTPVSCHVMSCAPVGLPARGPAWPTNPQPCTSKTMSQNSPLFLIMHSA